jgi:hypothetical protein
MAEARTRIVMVGGWDVIVQGSPDQVEKDLEIRAYPGGRFAWFTEIHKDRHVGINPDHVIALQHPAGQAASFSS